MNNPRYDLMSHIVDYEAGNLEEQETVELFQHLVNTGLAWELQGSYGRTAASMIRAGLITEKGGKTNESTRV